MTAPKNSLIVNYLVALAGATAGFLVGEFSAGFVISSALAHRGADAALHWVWLPWIVAPIAGAIAGALIFRCTEFTTLWHWVVLAVPVPVGAYIVTQIYFATRDISTPMLIRDSVVQLAISLAVTLTIGLPRMRRHRREADPIQVMSRPRP